MDIAYRYTNTASYDSMGDYSSPKRRDVVERLRRRIEIYRRRQNGVHQRYEYGQKSIYEQERQHALLLRQKWLESKAKKSSKSKSKSDNSGSDHRNQIIAKRLKHKLDSNSLENQQQQQQQHQNHPENVYRFEDDDGPTPAKTLATSTSNTTVEGAISSSVSVHIIHQIKGGNSQQDQKISTNVTVNQTIKPKTHTDSQNDVQTNVECKQEPEDSKSQSNSSSNNNNNQDLDESDLAEILNSFEKDEDLPQDIIDELNKFDEICRHVVQDSEENDTGLKQSDNSGNMFASNMYVDPSQAQGQIRTPPYRVSQAQVGQGMTEGGLAAETLKQMAAHHQQHHPGQEQFGVKSAVDPFSDLSETGNYVRNGYSPQDYYSGMPTRSGSAGSVGSYQSSPSIGYQQGKNMPVYGSNNNKSISHYTHTPQCSQSDTGPSSLQQLQNQVAHFNQGPQMEITQTQHMQVSDGSHRMQMSQTQHVQLRQPFPNISLTQQQGFATSPPNVIPNPNSSQAQQFMPTDPMTMQQQQQQQMMQSKLHSQQRQAQMQQYMNRPPPEYKMQHSMNGGMTPNQMGPNPLQTIQNMVNQTTTHPGQGYSSVKSETSDMQNGMRTAQMTAMQQQQMGMSMSQAQMNYSNQSMQRQASYPGALSHQMAARPQRPQNAPTYTSSIMRNQRPPNVNIGPDGLNISQPIVGNPRQPPEWPRAMNPMAAHEMRHVAPTTSAGMMQYRSYSSEGHLGNTGTLQMHHQNQRGMHMDHMQTQQAAMMQNSTHAQQMMMQQQRIQMTQQMGQNTHTRLTPPYGMSSQGVMTSQGNSYPQTSSSQEDILNLLDSAPNQSTDFYDVQTNAGASEANWYDIEDILGNQK